MFENLKYSKYFAFLTLEFLFFILNRKHILKNIFFIIVLTNEVKYLTVTSKATLKRNKSKVKENLERKTIFISHKCTKM